MDGAIARTERSGDDSELADGLTRREHDILGFERQWWKFAGSKEDAIKELFSMSATRYYQVLNALVDRPEALAADPMLVSACAGCAPAGRRPARRGDSASRSPERRQALADRNHTAFIDAIYRNAVTFVAFSVGTHRRIGWAR